MKKVVFDTLDAHADPSKPLRLAKQNWNSVYATK